MKKMIPVPDQPELLKEMIESFVTGEPITRTIEEGAEPILSKLTFHLESTNTNAQEVEE